MSCPQRFQRRQTAGFRDRGTESSSHRCGLGGGCPSCPLWGPRHPSVSRAGLGCGVPSSGPLALHCRVGLGRMEGGCLLCKGTRVPGACRLPPPALAPVSFNGSSPSRSGQGPRTPSLGTSTPQSPGRAQWLQGPWDHEAAQGSLAPPARSPAQPSECLRPPARPPTPGARGSLTGRAVFSLPALHPAAARAPACADCGPPCPLQGPAFPEGQGVEGLSHGGS